MGEFDLDIGETHAIVLALQMHCPVLIDERDARHVAFGLGLKVMGTVGLLEQASVKGLVDFPEALAHSRRPTLESVQKLSCKHWSGTNNVLDGNHRRTSIFSQLWNTRNRTTPGAPVA